MKTNMNLEKLERCWQDRFPGCEPIGHRLRLAFPERWIRFHSLPESKRYPESEHEYEIVLERHNSILGEFLRPGELLYLLSTGCSEATEPSRSDSQLLESDPDALPWRSVAMHNGAGGFDDPTCWDDPTYWHVFASQRGWHPGIFDPLLRLVANWTLVNLMFVALDCCWLVYPYDGGMDVIVGSTVQRDSLRAKHADWLSTREDGL